MSIIRSTTTIRCAMLWLPLVVGLGAGCSHEDAVPTYRTLASGVALTNCAVGDDFVYGVHPDSSGNEIARISRRTGAVDWLHDVRLLKAMVAANHTLYWLDWDGVHAWAEGATTRTDIRTIPEVHWSRSDSLVRFGERLCWGVWIDDSKNRQEEMRRNRAECVPLAGGDIETVSFETVSFVRHYGPPQLAAGFGHLYAGLGDAEHDYETFDLTQSLAPGGPPPQRVGHVVEIMTAPYFIATALGPAFVEINASLSQPRAIDTVTVLTPDLHQVPLPPDNDGLMVVGDRAISPTFSGPTAIDLQTGSTYLLAKIRRDGHKPSAFCGDDTKLFVEGPAATIVEIPFSPSTKGSNHGQAR